MSELRKKWQDFKKKHPNFEKSKNFKADAGPLMDEFYKSTIECLNLARKIEKDIETLGPRRKKLDVAVGKYKALIDYLVKQNPKSNKDAKPGKGEKPAGMFARGPRDLQADFAQVAAEMHEAQEDLESDIKRLAKRAQKYALESEDW